MGYGQNLKHVLDEKHMTVKALSRKAGISTDLICKENPLSGGETLPELLPEAGGLLTDTNKKSYIKHRTTDILMLYDYEELPQVDQLLANYFALDDQSREYIFDILSSTLKKHSDAERRKLLRKI